MGGAPSAWGLGEADKARRGGGIPPRRSLALSEDFIPRQWETTEDDSGELWDPSPGEG